MTQAPDVTRLAPSPTGALHLGNARTFLVTWLLARQRGWRVTMRIEDIDGPRVRRGAAEQAIDDLRWLGLDWDDGPLLQSSRLDAHRAAIDHLLSTGHAYPCVCTRSEVERAASAPHADDGASVYPGTCRGRFASVDDARRATGREPAIRFRIDDDAVARWDDAFAGPQSVPMRSLGDFVIAKADGTPSYQLAVVVDDRAARVTQVVRGDDLIDSTPRQMALLRALRSLDVEPSTLSVERSAAIGNANAEHRTEEVPTYWHLPLLVGPDGRRLAKRHGDTRLASYRAAGVGAGEILRRLAVWCGIDPPASLASARDLLDRFDIGRLPRERIIVAN